MNNAVYKLWLWFWLLIPANPILVRVVHGASRRSRHFMLRLGYLAILLGVVTIFLLQLSGGDTLSDLARGASNTFKLASYTQLALMCVLAPVFTASAITQEKDSRTYNILLTTPLSNAQIVLGSLMSRLFFVIMLLVAGLPIFFTTMIYGGVTTRQILQSFAIAGATAVLTGSLAICVSMVRVGTRRTIFSFYLMIALYLLAVGALGVWDTTYVAEAPLNSDDRKLSWLAPYHPFLCLEVALNRVQAPDRGMVAHYGPLDKYLLAYPHASYIVMTLVASLVLVVLSMFFVRSSDKEGEVGLGMRLKALILRQEAGERRKKPRHVWSNPVAWREAATRASAAGRGLRYIIMAGGALGALWLLVLYLQGPTRGGLDTPTTQSLLAHVVMIEFALVLIVATQTAATAITKEREGDTMDLLLTTPLTSAYTIWGKLRGLVSYVIPMIAVPTLSILFFGLVDVIRRTPQPVVPIEAFIELGVLMVLFSALACMLGLNASLKQKKTVQAVMFSVGVLVVLGSGATWLWRAIIVQTQVVGAALAAATPFTAIEFAINPVGLFPGRTTALSTDELTQMRVAAVIGTLAAGGVCYAIVYGMYKNMVRSFDMIIRKQSAQ